MKLTQLALIMTVGLLGVTAWLAWTSASEARGAKNQLEFYQRQQRLGSGTAEINAEPQTADASAIVAKENQLLSQQMAKAQTPIQMPPDSMPPPMTPEPAAPVVAAAPKKINHINMDDSSLPPPMTPRQRQVVGMPPIAKVVQFNRENGFVIINAGLNKKLEKGNSFALRRDKYIIARIKIGDVDQQEAIGDIDSRTVPAGVTIEAGDDVIQDLPPEA